MSWNNDGTQDPPPPPQQPPANPWGQPQQPPPAPQYGPPPASPYPPQPGMAPPTGPYQQPGTGQYPQQGVPQYTQPYPPQAPQGEKPRKRPGALIGIIAAAAVVVLLVVAGIVGVNIGNATFAPENSVKEYLEALTSGDAETALELSGADVEESDILLTDEVYSETEDRISRYRIGETVIDGDTATVTATITQGGENYEQDFTLAKAGKAAVVFDTWTLEAPELATVSVSVNAPEGTATTIAGVDVTEQAPADGGAWTLRAFPGSYEIAVAESEWFSAEPQTAVVAGFGAEASPDPAELSIALTDTGVQAATDAVNAFLDECVASAELEPDGCPFGATGGTPGYQYTNIVWTLDPRPTFSIGEYNGGTWSVTTDASGSASMVCDLTDPATGATGSATAGPLSVRISGVISGFGDDGAVYEP